MNRELFDFCDTVKGRQSSALEALLKIAETKDAMLHWERELILIPVQDEHDEGSKSIVTALALALAQVDRAEETILDAFCLSRQDQNATTTQNA